MFFSARPSPLFIRNPSSPFQEPHFKNRQGGIVARGGGFFFSSVGAGWNNSSRYLDTQLIWHRVRTLATAPCLLLGSDLCLAFEKQYDYVVLIARMQYPPGRVLVRLIFQLPQGRLSECLIVAIVISPPRPYPVVPAMPDHGTLLEYLYSHQICRIGVRG